MAISRALKAVTLTLAMVNFANAYIIDKACQPYYGNIMDAIDEALAMAEYAGWRVANDASGIDAFRKQMLGDNQKAIDEFTWRMDGMGDVTGTLTPSTFTNQNDRGLDTNILFRCGDASAVKDKNSKKDRWYDKDFVNRFPLMRYADRKAKKPIPVCASGVRAMTAVTQTTQSDPNEKMPHHIIYLCDPALKGDAVMGKEWQTKKWTGRDVERTAKYLSGTILHELLHSQKPDLLGKLPSDANEAYKFSDITSLSDDDKVANVHGYVLLATTSYIKGYEIATDGKMGKDLTPDKQPGKSPKDGHKY